MIVEEKHNSLKRTHAEKKEYVKKRAGMNKLTITAADGYALSALYATPVAESLGTIILSSGTGIKKEFYINFSQYLVQNGYNVLLYDYRGIGGSAPDNLKLSKSYMHEWGTMDMNAVLDFMVNEKGKTDIIWVGHSIGAQLSGLLQNKQHVKKVIAINAALGYWGYFPFPMNLMVFVLWYFVYPVMIKLYGYGAMRKIGWGENLPKNVLGEWREWCMSKTYFMKYLKQNFHIDRFYNFTVPMTAVYTSDDYIANDKTVPLMMSFFPGSHSRIMKLAVKNYTQEKVGHTGIFRKRFENNLWPALIDIIEN